MIERVPGIRGMTIRAVEAASTAHLKPNKPANELIHTIVDLSSFKQERLVAGIKLVGYVYPGFEEKCARTLCSPNKVPFRYIEPTASFQGGESTIFEISNKSNEGEQANHQKVLKIHRQSIGCNQNMLFDIAARVQNEYETICDWYKDIPGFVPPEDLVILHSHVFGFPAVASIQPFVKGEKKGIFEDFTPDELVQALNQSEPLRSNFISFGNTTLRKYQSHGYCIDLPGERNVALNYNNGRVDLVHLDPHVIMYPERID